MRKKLLLLSILLIILSLHGCKNKTTLNNTHFEQTVFYEIIPAILDSLHSDLYLISPPPPPPYTLDYWKHRIAEMDAEDHPYGKSYKEYLKSYEFEKIKKSWEKSKDSIVMDTTTYFLVVHDSVFSPKEGKSKLKEHYKAFNITPESLHKTEDFALDIKKLKTNHSRVKFKYLTEFPDGRKFWREKHKYKVVAYVRFSRIVFDKSKTFGVLNSSYVQHPLNGSGCMIFIKKDNKGVWIIDEIKERWIS